VHWSRGSLYRRTFSRLASHSRSRSRSITDRTYDHRQDHTGVSTCNCDINTLLYVQNIFTVYYTTLRYAPYGTNSTVLNIPCFCEHAHALPLQLHTLASGLPRPSPAATNTNELQQSIFSLTPPHRLILHAAPSRGSPRRPAARARNPAASLSFSRRSGQSAACANGTRFTLPASLAATATPSSCSALPFQSRGQGADPGHAAMCGAL
jgi:hypothetical protein